MVKPSLKSTIHSILGCISELSTARIFSFLFPIAWEVAFTLHFQYFITLFDLFLPSPQTNGASDIKNQEKTELLLIDDSLNPIGQLPELFNICSCLSLHVWYQILKTRDYQTKYYRWVQEI